MGGGEGGGPREGSEVPVGEPTVPGKVAPVQGSSLSSSSLSRSVQMPLHLVLHVRMSSSSVQMPLHLVLQHCSRTRVTSLPRMVVVAGVQQHLGSHGREATSRTRRRVVHHGVEQVVEVPGTWQATLRGREQPGTILRGREQPGTTLRGREPPGTTPQIRECLVFPATRRWTIGGSP